MWKKSDMRLTHKPALDLMDDPSDFSDLQVRRAKAARLCWHDGQVRLSHRNLERRFVSFITHHFLLIVVHN